MNDHITDNGRLRADVLAIVAHVPLGAIVTFGEVSAHLATTSEEVAALVTQLDDRQRQRLPLHRLVPTNGRVPSEAQREALQAEGFAFDDKALMEGFPVQVAEVARLKHGVPPRQPL